MSTTELVNRLEQLAKDVGELQGASVEGWELPTSYHNSILDAVNALNRAKTLASIEVED